MISVSAYVMRQDYSSARNMQGTHFFLDRHIGCAYSEGVQECLGERAQVV